MIEQARPWNDVSAPALDHIPAVREVLSHKPLLLGIFAIATCLATFAAWVVLAPVASAIIAQGVVVVENSVRAVQHPDGGIVKEILTADGRTVSAGDAVLRLDTEKQFNLEQSLERSYALLVARELRLRAELNSMKEVTIPDNYDGQILAKHIDIYEDQKANFFARKTSSSLRALELDNDCDQDVLAIAGLQKQLGQLRIRSDLAAEDQLAAADLAAHGSGTKRAFRETRATSAALQGEAAVIESKINELAGHVAHTRLETKRIAAAVLEEDQAELQQITRDKQDVWQKLSDSMVSLKRATIVAPVDGTIINLSAHTVGGVITPGETVLEIVPSREPLIIEAQIEPVDSDEIKVGSPVMVRTMGAGEQRLPMVGGSVSSISADRIYDKARKAGYFLARIDVDREKILAARGVDLRPGIPVEVMIKKKERSMITYLIDPVMRSFSHALKE